jgi:hypothetical protein
MAPLSARRERYDPLQARRGSAAGATPRERGEQNTVPRERGEEYGPQGEEYGPQGEEYGPQGEEYGPRCGGHTTRSRRMGAGDTRIQVQDRRGRRQGLAHRDHNELDGLSNHSRRRGPDRQTSGLGAVPQPKDQWPWWLITSRRRGKGALKASRPRLTLQSLVDMLLRSSEARVPSFPSARRSSLPA